LRQENREEDDVHLEINDIEKKRDSVGEGSPKNVFHIRGIESEPDWFDFTGIEVEKSGHNDIPEKSRKEYGDESPELERGISWHKSFREQNKNDEQHREEIHNLPRGHGDERKLGLEMGLEQGHNRTVHESEEGKYSRDEYPRHRHRRIVPWQKEPDSKRNEDNNSSEKCSQCEYISDDTLYFFMIVFVCANLPNGNRIETEVGDDREDGEIIIYLRVESISCDIQIVREDFDEEYRDERRRHLSGDLCERVGVDFFGGHFLRGILMVKR